ncbi:DNA replication protein DnaC [Duganella sp. BJB476]|nr:DNA replication protein DnaC [Duganella sp. BJB476]
MSAVAQTCTQHGEYVSMLIHGTWSNCVACDLAAENAAMAGEREAWRKELSARAWNAKLGRAAIPPRFADKHLGNYDPLCAEAEQALLIAKRYAASFPAVRKAGTCLIFVGDVGTGKTHLAVGIAHQVLEQGGQAIFASVRSAVGSIKETWERTSTKKEAQALRDLVEPDLLILDEVGVQFGSDTEKLILFDIINGRYEATRPTIVISNLAVAELEGYLGARAFDRLREGGGRLVVCNWESYRARRAA